MGAVVIRHAADIECEIMPVISPFVFASIISVGIGSLTSRVSSTVQHVKQSWYAGEIHLL